MYIYTHSIGLDSLDNPNMPTKEYLPKKKI